MHRDVPPTVLDAPADETAGEEADRRPSNWRETVESIVIAFILAFLFRTFEAEAFVIPTGSMAPTLMGRHKDFTCPKCHYRYRVNASDEVDDSSGRRRQDVEVKACTCPMCRYTASIATGDADAHDAPSYNGDRILAGKFAYQIGEPRRWDVVVFKYPLEAKINYIKRLIGLPSERIRIQNGDIFAQQAGEDEWTIQRKPSENLWSMLQLVYDNDYALAEMIERGWPPRWQAGDPDADSRANGWVVGDGYRSFTLSNPTASESWVRYRHVVPSDEDWSQIEQGPLPPEYPRRPQLISDFYAYNTNVTYADRPGPNNVGWNWVGDLVVECELESTSESGEVLLQLVEGNRTFECRLNLETGEARLSIEGMPTFAPQAATDVRGGRATRLAFSNLDDQLRLWVDGEEIQFESPTTYSPLEGNRQPGAADLSPAGIGLRNAAAAVRHLRLWRDIHYVAVEYPGNSVMADYLDRENPYRPSAQRAFEILSSPSQWSVFEDSRAIDFSLEADQFLCLGDNSPRSKDSRLWGAPGSDRHFVARDLLIGKALLIYWPHAWETTPHFSIPGTEIRFPFYPNFARMGSIR